ncbi:MAG: penicillin-binding protein 1C [Verrucomicrobiales bacterium]|nr:penicillin-binding protein 1C [Verrucomicrobiales bacterium]
MKRKIGIGVLAAALLYGVVIYIVPIFFPLPENLLAGPPQGLLFLDRKEKPVRRLLDGDLRADEPSTYDEFPKSLIEATLAAEDCRFFSHNGLDYMSIGRAVRDAAVKKRFVSGASTVTQQTIKLYSPPRKRVFRTKFIEAFTARKLEMFADKETILTAYFNHLPYGNQFTGARTAARGYFGKPLSDLSIAESALLAGLPNKPSYFNPWKNPDAARKRQLWILGRMKEERYIDETEYTTAAAEPLNLLPGPAQVFHAPHFTELLREQNPDTIKEAISGSRTLRTTLDLDLQRFVESTVSAELARLTHQSNESNDLQSAVVVIDNETGDVLALTGSRSFFSSRSGQINGAWRPRSAGSTLKPFTYLVALERGYNAASVLPDTPIEYITSTGAYQPVNFDRRFNGPVSIRHALANSLNVPAVKLLDQLGGPEVLHSTLTKDLHLTGLKSDPVEYGLGLTLGNAEVRLLELTNAYACLARLGQYLPYRFVMDESTPEPVEVFDADCAWVLADILSDNDARVAAFGIHSPLNLPFRAACKTGTSTDFRDNWTIGFTPNFTVGVWVGSFSNRPLNQISGSMGAAPIFHQVMVRLNEGGDSGWYETPADAERRIVDTLSGKLAETIDLPSSRVREEWFVNGSVPFEATDRDYTEDGKTKLSLLYTNWWRSEANDLQTEAALEEVLEVTPEFRIVSPLEGTVAYLDPDLPNDGSQFPLKVAGSGQEEIEWASDSLEVRSDGQRMWVVLQPGEHEIVAHDRKSGRTVASRFRVEAL